MEINKEELEKYVEAIKAVIGAIINCWTQMFRLV